MLAIDPEAPLLEEPAAEHKVMQLEGEEEQGMAINDNEKVIDKNHY